MSTEDEEFKKRFRESLTFGAIEGAGIKSVYRKRHCPNLNRPNVRLAMINAKRYPYYLNVLIGIDQFANALLWRNPDETISSHLGKQARQYGGSIPWSRPLNALVWRLLERIDPGHCADSIEEDE